MRLQTSIRVDQKAQWLLERLGVRTAPHDRSLLGDAVIVVFLFAQVCDGMFTYYGVHAWGLVAEANPIVSWYMATLGVGLALLAAKAFAIACAALLHLHARHRTVALLTILYLALAVRPWVNLLLLYE